MADLTTVIPGISREQYAKRFKEIVAELAEMTQKKNANYACDSNAFQNFTLIEELSNGKITTESGLLTRMSDKFQRLVNLSCGATNNFESKIDNYRDLAVYAIIGSILEEVRNGDTAKE